MTSYLLDTNHLSAMLQKNADDLNEILAGLDRHGFSEDAARELGRVNAQLRRKGRPIPDVDVQIAAIARLDDLTVITADAHFNNVDDLKTENWLR